MLAVAALAGMMLVEYVGRRYKLDANKLFDGALIILVAGFIGARWYHITNEWAYYSAHTSEVWKVWNGGLALHGGLIGGCIALIIVARRWKWNWLLVADIAAPAMAVAQAIGRWGNYFNQELFGRPTSLPWGIPIDHVNRPPTFVLDNYFHPTFLYESLGLLCIAAVLLWLHFRRWKKSTPLSKPTYGGILFVYIVLTSGLRIATELLRIDRTPIIAGVRLPIIVAAGFGLLALLTLLIRLRRRHGSTA